MYQEPIPLGEAIKKIKDERENPVCLACGRDVDITGLPGGADQYICEKCMNGARVAPLRGLKAIDQPEGVVLGRHRKRDRRCHELAGKFMFDNPTWTLHHAILLNWDSPDVEYTHAFTEKDGVVYDPTLNKFYKKEDYYAFFSVSVKATYTLKEMAQAVLKYEKWCAWHVLEARKAAEGSCDRTGRREA